MNSKYYISINKRKLLNNNLTYNPKYILYIRDVIYLQRIYDIHINNNFYKWR